MTFPTGHRVLENITYLIPAFSTCVLLPFSPNPCLKSTSAGKFVLTLPQDGHSPYPVSGHVPLWKPTMLCAFMSPKRRYLGAGLCQNDFGIPSPALEFAVLDGLVPSPLKLSLKN